MRKKDQLDNLDKFIVAVSIASVISLVITLYIVLMYVYPNAIFIITVLLLFTLISYLIYIEL